jgi:hypothetical protein
MIRPDQRSIRIPYSPYAEPDCPDCADTGVVAIPDDPGDRWSPPSGPWTYRLCDCVSEPTDGKEDYR